MELGQCSPSLASLQRVCQALDTGLSDLLGGGGSAGKTPVARRADRESLRSEWSKASAESLVPQGRKAPYSALLVYLDPGGKTGELRSRGSHFFVYCLRGKVRIHLGELPYEVSAGDSVIVDQARAACENVGRTRAELLILNMRGE